MVFGPFGSEEVDEVDDGGVDDEEVDDELLDSGEVWF